MKRPRFITCLIVTTFLYSNIFQYIPRPLTRDFSGSQTVLSAHTSTLSPHLNGRSVVTSAAAAQRDDQGQGPVRTLASACGNAGVAGMPAALSIIVVIATLLSALLALAGCGGKKADKPATATPAGAPAQGSAQQPTATQVQTVAQKATALNIATAVWPVMKPGSSLMPGTYEKGQPGYDQLFSVYQSMLALGEQVGAQIANGITIKIMSQEGDVNGITLFSIATTGNETARFTIDYRKGSGTLTLEALDTFGSANADAFRKAVDSLPDAERQRVQAGPQMAAAAPAAAETPVPAVRLVTATPASQEPASAPAAEAASKTTVDMSSMADFDNKIITEKTNGNGRIVTFTSGNYPSWYMHLDNVTADSGTMRVYYNNVTGSGIKIALQRGYGEGDAASSRVSLDPNQGFIDIPWSGGAPSMLLILVEGSMDGKEPASITLTGAEWWTKTSSGPSAPAQSAAAPTVEAAPTPVPTAAPAPTPVPGTASRTGIFEQGIRIASERADMWNGEQAYKQWVQSVLTQDGNMKATGYPKGVQRTGNLSEGVGYFLIQAAANNDKATFDKVFTMWQNYLFHKDGPLKYLSAWYASWDSNGDGTGSVISPQQSKQDQYYDQNDASDASVDIAFGLFEAHDRGWKGPKGEDLRALGLNILHAVIQHETQSFADIGVAADGAKDIKLLAAGNWTRDWHKQGDFPANLSKRPTIVYNPSYARFYRYFAEVDSANRDFWLAMERSKYYVLEQLLDQSRPDHKQLIPNWIGIQADPSSPQGFKFVDLDNFNRNQANQQARPLSGWDKFRLNLMLVEDIIQYNYRLDKRYYKNAADKKDIETQRARAIALLEKDYNSYRIDDTGSYYSVYYADTGEIENKSIDAGIVSTRLVQAWALGDKAEVERLKTIMEQNASKNWMQGYYGRAWLNFAVMLLSGQLEAIYREGLCPCSVQGIVELRQAASQSADGTDVFMPVYDAARNPALAGAWAALGDANNPDMKGSFSSNKPVTFTWQGSGWGGFGFPVDNWNMWTGIKDKNPGNYELRLKIRYKQPSQGLRVRLQNLDAGQSPTGADEASNDIPIPDHDAQGASDEPVVIAIPMDKFFFQDKPFTAVHAIKQIVMNVYGNDISGSIELVGVDIVERAAVSFLEDGQPVAAVKKMPQSGKHAGLLNILPFKNVAFAEKAEKLRLAANFSVKPGDVCEVNGVKGRIVSVAVREGTDGALYECVPLQGTRSSGLVVIPAAIKNPVFVVTATPAPEEAPAPAADVMSSVLTEGNAAPVVAAPINPTPTPAPVNVSGNAYLALNPSALQNNIAGWFKDNKRTITWQGKTYEVLVVTDVFGKQRMISESLEYALKNGLTLFGTQREAEGINIAAAALIQMKTFHLDSRGLLWWAVSVDQTVAKLKDLLASHNVDINENTIKLVLEQNKELSGNDYYNAIVKGIKDRLELRDQLTIESLKTELIIILQQSLDNPIEHEWATAADGDLGVVSQLVRLLIDYPGQAAQIAKSLDMSVQELTDLTTKMAAANAQYHLMTLRELGINNDGVIVLPGDWGRTDPNRGKVNLSYHRDDMERIAAYLESKGKTAEAAKFRNAVNFMPKVMEVVTRPGYQLRLPDGSVLTAPQTGALVPDWVRIVKDESQPEGYRLEAVAQNNDARTDARSGWDGFRAYPELFRQWLRLKYFTPSDQVDQYVMNAIEGVLWRKYNFHKALYEQAKAAGQPLETAFYASWNYDGSVDAAVPHAGNMSAALVGAIFAKDWTMAGNILDLMKKHWGNDVYYQHYWALQGWLDALGLANDQTVPLVSVNTTNKINLLMLPTVLMRGSVQKPAEPSAAPTFSPQTPQFDALLKLKADISAAETARHEHENTLALMCSMLGLTVCGPWSPWGKKMRVLVNVPGFGPVSYLVINPFAIDGRYVSFELLPQHLQNSSLVAFLVKLEKSDGLQTLKHMFVIMVVRYIYSLSFLEALKDRLAFFRADRTGRSILHELTSLGTQARVRFMADKGLAVELSELDADTLKALVKSLQLPSAGAKAPILTVIFSAQTEPRLTVKGDTARLRIPLKALLDPSGVSSYLRINHPDSPAYAAVAARVEAVLSALNGGIALAQQLQASA